MYFCFNESHSKNGTSTTNIYLSSCDDYQSKDFSPVYLTFNDFFEKLSSDILTNMLKELDKILEYSKKDCINEEVWFKYKVAYSLTIPKIGERYMKLISKINYDSEKEGIEITLYKNKRPRQITFENNSDFFKSKPLGLFDHLPQNKSAEYNLTIKREAICNTEIELLYAFLQCLFNSQQNTFYVKKCKYCKKYYIDSYYRTSYCQRTHLIKGKYIPCSEINHFIKKQNEYKNFVTEDNYLQNKIQNNYEENIYFKYLNDRDEIVDKCIKTRNLSLLNEFIENSKIKYP